MARWSFTAICLLACLCSLAQAQLVIFPETGPIIVKEDCQLLLTGDGGTVTHGPGTRTEITGTFAPLAARILDPDLDDLIEGPTGDATLTPDLADPIREARIHIKFWDVIDGGVVKRKGWFKVYRAVGGVEEVFMSGTVDPLREIVDIGNLTHDDSLDCGTAARIPAPTLADHGSAAVAEVLEMINGASNPDVTFSLAVSTSGTRWAIAYDCAAASFDGLRDRSDKAYAENLISSTAYDAIVTATGSAHQEYSFTVNEGAHGDACRVTMETLGSQIAAWVTSGDIQSPALANRLRVYCQTVAVCCHTSSNYHLPVTWGTVAF